MTRWAMSIDLDACTGCGSCIVACAQENNLPPGNPGEPIDRLLRWIELLPAQVGEYPLVRGSMKPLPCQQCDNPPCIKVCPVYATYRNPEGLVPQIYHRCIGCRYCVNACPYACKYFNWWDPSFPEPMERGFNPDVSVRTRGVTEKCNFCLHRLQIARNDAAVNEEEFTAGSYRTACQEICPAKAIRFGDLDEVGGALEEAEHDPRSRVLLEELGTEPKVFYLEERT